MRAAAPRLTARCGRSLRVVDSPGLVLAVGLLLGVFSGVDDRYRYNGTDFETFPLPGATTPSP